ncbi:MAG: arginine--tRNA ligase [Salinivirgaceae bacterium]|nr:arginine--tRNA ligase [Salinivirgaceae bacterium]
MDIQKLLKDTTAKAIKTLYSADANLDQITFSTTRKEFVGDFTLVVFPFLKISKQKPEDTAAAIGAFLRDNLAEVADFNVVKGFLNIQLSATFWTEFLNDAIADERFGMKPKGSSGKTFMVEYSSPNTNKPLHLGHIRNNLYGFSVAQILEANGHNVIKANLVNDRGIHICKSMLAWQKWGNGATPESLGVKGDKLVGDYYVRFDKEYKKQIAELKAQGLSDDDAANKAPIILEAREMLRKWEAGDKEVVDLWKTMNGWVYAGFDVTYKALGISFDKVYYESQTYMLGKSIVMKGLEDGVLFKKDDNSIWIDLTADGLDQKLLLRGDGTSVYMTQDLGTAHQRFEQYKLEELLYVVGNEQIYHFQVLKLVLKKLGFDWSDHITHLSYGMVELPEGKMKSREGTVVDADDLIAEMVKTARETSDELGKLQEFDDDYKSQIYNMVGLGALKYFILKVDPKKTMLFNPKESIDFNGNTGPFIQYTHARICSVLRKAEEAGLKIADKIDAATQLNEKEMQLAKLIFDFPAVVADAGTNYSPALIANHLYSLAKEYNQFYHDCSILKEEDAKVREFRLTLSKLTAKVIKTGAALMGIQVPERM